MSDDTLPEVPVWTLSTQDIRPPAPMGDQSMTPERLDGLRSALSALSDTPIATLEAHPMPGTIDRSRAVRLAGVSPLAQQLSQLVSRTPKVVADGGETLYRMVIPAKFAAQMGSGLVTPMVSKAASGGIHGALMSGSQIAAQASFVPVSAGKAATAGAATGSAATAGAAVAGAGALTVAAPLILMAVAVGVSAYADQQRQQAIERITELLQELQADLLADEQHKLDGCRSAISKAAAILLDQGRLGTSLGLGPAVHTIDTAVAKAESRIAKWERAVTGLGEGSVELDHLLKAIPTIDHDGGEFYVHLELARMAIAMKRRVLVLQAVEHAQMDENNLFERFVQSLRSDEIEVDAIEDRLGNVLSRLSTLELDRSHGVRDFMFTSSEVDRILSTSRRLRGLSVMLPISGRQPDVVIEIGQEKDGSVIVFPAIAA